MRACSMASGGVMFIPDEIEHATAQECNAAEAAANAVKYDDLVRESAEDEALVAAKPFAKRVLGLFKKDKAA